MAKKELFVLLTVFCTCLHTVHAGNKNIYDTNIVQVYIDSSKHINDSTKAFYYAGKAVTEAGRINNNILLADAIKNKADLYYNYEKFTEAIFYYKTAEEKCRQINASGKVCEILMNMGRINYEYGEYDKAMKLYFEAIDMYEKLKFEDVNKGWVLRYIGSVYKREEDYKNALKYYQNAIPVFTRFNDYSGLASCFNNIGTIYGETKSDSLQMEYYHKALSICMEHNDMGRASIILDNIGTIYSSRGEYDKALEHFRHSYKILTESKPSDHCFIAENLIYTGTVYLRMGKLGQALDIIRRAEIHALKTEKKQKLNLQDIYSIYSSIYEEKGDVKNALEYHKLNNLYADSLKSTAMASEIAQVRFKYEQEKAEQQIEKLKIEQELKDQQLEFEQRKLVILFAGLSCVLVFLIIVFFQKRKLSSAYNALVAKNIEIVRSEINNKADEKQIQYDETGIQKFRYTSSQMTEEHKELLLNKITEIMDTDKLFMDDDLTVIKLAQVLDTNKSYISQTINEKLDKNFSTFINEYRIKEARRILANSENWHFTIEAVAKRTGFKSNSAFINAFKKYTGVTPSFFLKSIKDKF